MKCIVNVRRSGVVTAALLAALQSAGLATAATTVWSNTNADGAWGSAGNWSGGEPTFADRAVIRKTGSDRAVLSQLGEQAGTIDVGTLGGGTSGELRIESGSLQVFSTGADAFEIGGFGTDGTIDQVGGDVTVNGWTSLGSFNTGAGTLGTGTYNISGGSFTTQTLNLGLRGQGVVNQSGGSTVESTGTTYVGRGNVGTYTLNGGTLNVGTALTLPADTAMWVGFGGDTNSATFNQTGGQVNSNGKIIVGNSAPGTYNLTGGDINFTATNDFVFTGNSTFNLGNASTSGTVNNTGAGTTNLYIGDSASSTASLNGWGQINLNWIYNNGTVTADGYGSERLLDFSGSERVFNTQNTATSGWYAVNGGAVTLPTLRFDTVLGQPTQTWGDNLYDLTPEVINSVSVTISTTGGQSRKGGINGTLFATDRGDLPDFGVDADVIGVWEFIVELDLDSESTDLAGSSIAFRYDDTLASDLGIDEADLEVSQYIGGQWVTLASTVDVGNNVISASTDSFSFFAVGVGVVPEPGMFGVMLAGLGTLAVRRRGRG